MIRKRDKSFWAALAVAVAVLSLAVIVACAAYADDEGSDLEPSPHGAGSSSTGADNGADPADAKDDNSKGNAKGARSSLKDARDADLKKPSGGMKPPELSDSVDPEEEKAAGNKGSASVPADAAEQERLSHLEKLPEPLKTLALAEYIFNTAPLGPGGDPCATAFQQIAANPGKFKNDLFWTAANGSPAGRIYAACLIRLFDQPQGDRILAGFKDDRTLVLCRTRTKREHYMASELVMDLLSRSRSIKLR